LKQTKVIRYFRWIGLRKVTTVLPGVLIAMVLLLCGAANALAPAIASPDHGHTLVVGSEQDYPPFATGMTDDTAAGFTVDLWKAVAAEAGLTYTLRVLPFHQLLQQFKDGEIDVLINLAKSPERQAFADFSVPHVIVHGAIFVRQGESSIRTEDDLADKSIIVVNADLAHEYAVSKGWAKQLVPVATAAEGLRLLASGQHNALLLSKLVGMQTIHANGLTNIKALKPTLGSAQKFAFAVHKGQSDLLYQLNEGLALTKTSGIYNALYDQWFGVYEARELEFRDLLVYILPVVAFFLAWVSYLFYRRHIERNRALADIAQSRDLLLTVIETMPARVFWKDRQLRYLGCNTAFARDAGMSHSSELIGKDDFQVGWAAQAERYRADDQAVMDSDTARLSFEELQTTPDGRTIWLRTSKIPLRDQDQKIIGLLGLYEDITTRKQAEEKLRQLSTAIEQSPLSVVITDLQARIQYVNPRFTEVTGFSAAEVLGQNPRILHSNRTPPENYVEMWRNLTSGQVWQGEFINRRKNGEIYWENSQIAPVTDASGAVTHYVALKDDITERKHEEAIFRALFEQSSFLAGILDQQGHLINVNSVALGVIGTSRELVIGQYFPDTPWWTNAQDREKLINCLTLAYTGKSSSFEATHNTIDGGHISVMFSAMPIVLEDGAQIAVVGVDISARKELEDQVRKLAFQDPLTQLPNRRLLNDRLHQLMASSKRTHFYSAVLFLDLDNFKPLNDLHGHDLGDLLLIEVAERLSACVREIDTVARLGGDEFVVMLRDLNTDKIKSTEQARAVAEKIRVALSAPHRLRNKQAGKHDAVVEHHCSASIGVVVFISNEASQDDILKWADAAMYQAKEAGRNTICFHQAK